MLASRQSSLISVRRDAWIEINLSAVEANLAIARSWLSSGCKLMAVVKSDAYGHGASELAPVLAACGVNWLGVASVDEGCQLRLAGISTPVLILSPCPSWAMPAAIKADLNVTVTSAAQVIDMSRAAAAAGLPGKVQIKVDSGMHRLGVPPASILEIVEMIAGQPLTLTGLFSHLAQADDAQASLAQNQCFSQVVDALARAGQRPALVHLSCGEAARRFPALHYDMVRIGLYLYGLEPRAISSLVTPALSVKGRINHLFHIEDGQSVGYGFMWEALRPSLVASIPIGYGDGVDRRLSNNMTGLIGGKEVRQVGAISMDQMLFDVTDAPEISPGDVITLIGSQSRPEALSGAAGKGKTLYLADWAAKLDTVTYELACRLRVRLPRIYTREKILSLNDEQAGQL